MTLTTIGARAAAAAAASAAGAGAVVMPTAALRVTPAAAAFGGLINNNALPLMPPAQLAAPWGPLAALARWLGETAVALLLARYDGAAAAPLRESSCCAAAAVETAAGRSAFTRRQRPLLVLRAGRSIATRLIRAAGGLGRSPGAAAAAAAALAPPLGALLAGGALLRASGRLALLLRWRRRARRRAGSAAAAFGGGGGGFGGAGMGRAGGGVRTAAADGGSAGGAAQQAALRRRRQQPPPARLVVVTFNARGVMDRWRERRPLLRASLAATGADVVCLQEVLTGEYGQDADLVGPEYATHGVRAALDSLAASGPAGAAFAAAARGALALPPLRGLLVNAPAAIEAWRERRGLAGAWARALRDVTLAPFFGNAICSRLPASCSSSAGSSSSGSGSFLGRLLGGGGSGSKAAATGAAETLLLGSFRAAQRLRVAVPPPQEQQQDAAVGGEEEQQQQRRPLHVWLVNAHLDHACPDTRARQAASIVEWMAPVSASAAAVVITGDLNGPPDEPLHALLRGAGYESASKLANGAEPAATWPSGIVAPLMDAGEPHCADYVYVRPTPGHALHVAAAGVAGDAPAPGDATLYPSDHLGLRVALAVWPVAA